VEMVSHAIAELDAVRLAPTGETAVKTTRHPVFWNQDEAGKVLARALTLLAESPELPRHIAARRAQEELLPPDRWRKFKQVRDTEFLFGVRKSSRRAPTPAVEPEPVTPPPAALAANATTAPEPPRRKFPRAIQPALPALADEPPLQAAAAPAPVLPEPPKPATAPEPSIAADPATVRAVAEQIAPMIAGAVAEGMRGVFAAIAEVMRSGAFHDNPPSASTALPSAVRPPPPPRNRLPRITVVGLIHQQENDVAAAFGGVVEFVFVKSQKQGGGGHGGAGMLTKSASSDLVIAMTDFIGHDVEASAKHLHIPFERVKGSVSALKRWITDWLATGAKA
jgi:hypothetical protein